MPAMKMRLFKKLDCLYLLFFGLEVLGGGKEERDCVIYVHRLLLVLISL